MPRRPDPPGPTYVARTLRRLREEAGLSAAAVAREVNAPGVGLGQYTISRYESGATVPPAAAIRALAAFYGADAATTERMASESREARAEDARVVLHRPYEHYFQAQINDLEAQATSIRALTCTTLVAGLLQTDAYAAQLAGVLDGDDRAQWLKNRAATRAVIDDPAKSVTVVTTEGPLRYPFGGPAVMAGQLAHLIEVSRRPNVAVGVLPVSAAGVTRPLMSDSTLYRLRDGNRRVIYGVRDGTVILDDDRLIGEHAAVIDRAVRDAVWGDDARGLLADLRGSYA